MKCHYEVLSLERDVDEAQIKTAYRKAALKYHPDKNLDDPDGAKALFQLVQQAYEVSSTDIKCSLVPLNNPSKQSF